ncbi:MAG: hypothetical protein KA375_04875 [Vitreoscilla sp.]|nr:hypothetical protein [Vitreoscilla sp.]
MATLTDEIAATAARMVVEEGLEYGPAKRRAARDLGRRSGRQGELPPNEQVEDEVRDYIALFCADTQPVELSALRRLAACWLERLVEFRPHLTGAVWRGTATRLSPIVIDLYCDDPKAPEIALLNLGLAFDSDSASGSETVVLTLTDRCPGLGGEPVTLHCVVRDHDELRGALKPDAQGRSWRGNLAALRQRIMETET